MTQASMDSGEFKAQQRAFWDGVAAGWRAWWHVFEEGAQVVSDRLVVMADVQPGFRVLDVATGLGEPALTAARAVGPTGSVLAIDQAPQMLALGRERAAELGVGNVDFREGDAETVDLPEMAFDAVLSRWGLMLMPDLAGTLRRLRMALKPGGRLAAATWAEPSRVPGMTLAMGVLARELGGTPPAERQGPFALSDPAALEAALRDVGYSDVTSELVATTSRFSSAAEYVRFTEAVAPSVHALVAQQPAERQEQIWRAIEAAAERYAQPDGSVRFENVAICAAGQR